MAKARMAEFESTGDEKPPRSEKVVVYDPGTGRIVYLRCRTAAQVARAIRDMVVRGAPLIGCAAAYGMALE